MTSASRNSSVDIELRLSSIRLSYAMAGGAARTAAPTGHVARALITRTDPNQRESVMLYQP